MLLPLAFNMTIRMPWSMLSADQWAVSRFASGLQQELAARLDEAPPPSQQQPPPQSGAVIAGSLINLLAITNGTADGTVHLAISVAVSEAHGSLSSSLDALYALKRAARADLTALVTADFAATWQITGVACIVVLDGRDMGGDCDPAAVPPPLSPSPPPPLSSTTLEPRSRRGTVILLTIVLVLLLLVCCGLCVLVLLRHCHQDVCLKVVVDVEWDTFALDEARRTYFCAAAHTSFVAKTGLPASAVSLPVAAEPDQYMWPGCVELVFKLRRPLLLALRFARPAAATDTKTALYAGRVLGPDQAPLVLDETFLQRWSAAKAPTVNIQVASAVGDNRLRVTADEELDNYITYRRPTPCQITGMGLEWAMEIHEPSPAAAIEWVSTAGTHTADPVVSPVGSKRPRLS